MKSLINATRNTLTRFNNEEEGNDAVNTMLVTVLSVIILVFAYKMMTGDSEGGGIIGDIGGMLTGILGGVGGKIASMVGLGG